MRNCSFCQRNLMCPDHPPVFPDNSYSLGFKEGVMWVKAIQRARRNAFNVAFYDGSWEENEFFMLWDQSLEEGR